MRLLTVKQAAERLGLKAATLRFFIWTHKIETVREGRAVRFCECTTQQLIEGGTMAAKRS
jgi:excisionase family DNA binding protein